MTKVSTRGLFLAVLCSCMLAAATAAACAENCLTCSSSGSCLQCMSSTYIAIASVPTKGCLPCKPGCKTCSSEYSTCTSCASAYFMNASASKCQPCRAASCDVCDQSSPEMCLACSTGYYLIDASGTCENCALYPNAATCRESMILSCQPGYFVSGGQSCLSCGNNCIRCTSPTYCSACKDGYFGSNCTTCHSSCLTCSRPMACLTCRPGYYLNSSLLCLQCDLTTNVGCVGCDTAGKCTKCLPTYYLDGSKLCASVTSPIKGCARYEFSSVNQGLICRQCDLGLYATVSGLNCLPCSLLCSNCSGMYSSSSCTSCSGFGSMVSSGVCYSLQNTVTQTRSKYISEWNFPTNFSYLGSTTTIVDPNCPSWKFSSRTRLKFGIVNGYNIAFTIKVTFSIADPSSIAISNFSLALNNQTILVSSLQPATEIGSYRCSQNVNSSTVEFVQTLQTSIDPNFDLTSLAPLNSAVNRSNYLELATFTAGLQMAISELIVTYVACDSSCALCRSSTECFYCKDTSLLLQGQKCVPSCSEFYYRWGNQCIKTCPAGTFANPYIEVWSCNRCPLECSRCQSSFKCISCNAGYYLHKQSCQSVCPTEYFANNISLRCEPCSPPCSTCASQKLCLSCSYNFLLNTTCVQSSDCPAGTFASLQSMSCQPCLPPCLTCLSETACLKCRSQSGLYYQGSCYRSCPDGYLNNSALSTCDKCAPQCLTCKGSVDMCTKCSNGFLLDGRCLVSCPDGLYENYSVMECNLCSFPCVSCRTNSYTCKLCASGYILHEQYNTCISESNCSSTTGSFLSVKNGSIISNGTPSAVTVKSCAKCPSQCFGCISRSLCLACAPFYYLLDFACIVSCPFGYYANKRTWECTPCNTQCTTCLSEPGFCTSCPTNFRLTSSSTCESGCMAANYLSPSCEQCSAPCYSCQNSVSMCSSCIVGYYLNLASHECLQSCFSGYFPNRMSQTCEKCNNNCLACTNSSAECTQCPGSSYLLVHDPVSKSGSCVKSCPARYYPAIYSLISQICAACQEPCLECWETSSKCLSCLTGLLNNDQCVAECPTGKYANNSDSTCRLCSSKCLSCFGPSENQCYSCRPGYYYSSSGYACVLQCPLGSIGSVSNLCMPCQFPCRECTNTTTTCLSCWQADPSLVSYYYYKSQCLKTCPSRTYQLGSTCSPCPEPCSECLAPGVCLTCATGKFYLLNRCLVQCPDGYFQDMWSMACRKCQYPCKTCTSQTECLSCVDGVRIGNFCSAIDECPTGQFLLYTEVNGICQSCVAPCSSCVDRADNCLACTNSSFVLFNKACLQACPQGYYKLPPASNQNSSTCTECPSQCTLCSSQLNCSACAQGFKWLEGNCVVRCPFAYFSTGQNSTWGGQCSKCEPNCKTCVNSASNCLSCLAGYFLYKFQCVPVCPLGTYAEEYELVGNNNGICRECSFPCSQCLNSQVCALCLNGFYLHLGSCVEKCKKPLVVLDQPSNMTCLAECPQSHRFTLESGSSLKCSQTCPFPYILSSDASSCLLNCPANQYADSQLKCSKTDNNNNNSSSLNQLGLIPSAQLDTFVDSNYSVVMKLTFNAEVDYTHFSPSSITVSLLRSSLYDDRSSQMSRLLIQDSEVDLSFYILKAASTYLMIQLNPATLYQEGLSQQTQLRLSLNSNSNLLVRNRVSAIPLQAPDYKCLLPAYEAYPDEYEVSDNFRTLGLVMVVFLLLLAGVLFTFNWYAKIYESMHYFQLVFLLSVLEVQYPPNLWLFLQGFKNMHFYFIGNWFLPESNLNAVSSASPKIKAIFIDSNFIRICGHTFCLVFILSAIFLVLFLGKFIKKHSNLNVSQFGSRMFTKFKLLKWSHLHDLAMTSAMIISFGFFAQTYDYSTASVMQIIGIATSYICVSVLVAYCVFMSYKLHSMVKLSLRDPRQFCDKKYLFRDNMLSITESAVHPKELYLNYLRASRIIVFGAVVGLFHSSPMLCTGAIMTVMIISSLIYLLSRPYPDHLQNILLGLTDIFSSLALLFICVIHFKSVNQSRNPQLDNLSYLTLKWRLGWAVIIFTTIGAFLLLAELLVSIVKGNSSPLSLSAEDPKRMLPLLEGPPKIIQVCRKTEKVKDDWQVYNNREDQDQDQDQSSAFGFKYEVKQV